jgi:hypothetical protein
MASERVEEEAMSAARFFAGVSLGVGLLATMGCGGSPGCAITGLNVVPSTATADHAAAAPGNHQVFTAAFTTSGDCRGVGTLVAPNANWTASDPSVHIFPSTPSILMTATCTAAVAGPVTITATPATGQMFTGRATLTCN